jgi:hypothetical protein
MSQIRINNLKVDKLNLPSDSDLKDEDKLLSVDRPVGRGGSGNTKAVKYSFFDMGDYIETTLFIDLRSFEQERNGSPMGISGNPADQQGGLFKYDIKKMGNIFGTEIKCLEGPYLTTSVVSGYDFPNYYGVHAEIYFEWNVATQVGYTLPTPGTEMKKRLYLPNISTDQWNQNNQLGTENAVVSGAKNQVNHLYAGAPWKVSPDEGDEFFIISGNGGSARYIGGSFMIKFFGNK